MYLGGVLFDLDWQFMKRDAHELNQEVGMPVIINGVDFAAKSR